MNKNLIYLGVLSLILSHSVLERLIGLFVRSNVDLAADISTVLFLVYILPVPILLAYLAKLWKLELKSSALVYGIVILLVVTLQSVVMFVMFSPEITVGQSLFNIVFQIVIPLIVFVVSYLILAKIRKSKPRG